MRLQPKEKIQKKSEEHRNVAAVDAASFMPTERSTANTPTTEKVKGSKHTSNTSDPSSNTSNPHSNTSKVRKCLIRISGRTR